jgi:NADH-quinone oxidoreductase E subunit
MEEIVEKIIRKYPEGKRENLLPVLQDIQNETGHLTPEALVDVSEYLRIPVNKILGVATFYDQFHLKKKGKYHVQLCRGTNCHLSKSAALLSEVEKVLKVKAGQTSKDGKFSLEVVTCMGACSNSPMININGQFHSGIMTSNLVKLIRSLKG